MPDDILYVYVVFLGVVCMHVAKNIFEQLGIGSRDRPFPWLVTGAVFAFIVSANVVVGFKIPAWYLGVLGAVLFPFMFRWRIRFDRPQPPSAKETPPESDFVQRRK